VDAIFAWHACKRQLKEPTVVLDRTQPGGTGLPTKAWWKSYLPRRRWLVVGSILGLALAAVLVLTTGPENGNPIEHVPLHPMASHSLPPFITAPGETDVLLVCMAFVLVGAVLAAGVFFFWLHSLPERMVHNSTKVHFDIVAVLGLLSLFTHIHLFWVAALLLALVKMPQWSIPDFSSLLGRIAAAIEGRSHAQRAKDGAEANGRRAPVQEG
jgi:hypothetical protein